jgi:hypothetical protein
MPGDRGTGGALLFGYFLLGKQEKVTRAPWMACEKAQGREAVVARTHQSRAKTLDPGFRRDDEVGSFARMRRQKLPPGRRGWKLRQDATSEASAGMTSSGAFPGDDETDTFMAGSASPSRIHP